MTRPARYTPDNPWQRATALGKRLRTAGESHEYGPAWAVWAHPDLPLAYRIDVTEDDGTATWTLTGILEVRLAAGTMDPATARQYVATRATADGRRLAAAAMLRYTADAVSAP